MMAAYGSFTSGQVLTAAELNGTWVEFTPSWANVTLGSGATEAWAYCYVPGGMWISGETTLGTSGSFTGTVTMTIPDGQTSATPVPGASYGTAIYFDATGTDSIGATAVNNNATSIQFVTSTVGSVNGSSPFTWTTGDTIAASLFVPL